MATFQYGGRAVENVTKIWNVSFVLAASCVSVYVVVEHYALEMNMPKQWEC